LRRGVAGVAGGVLGTACALWLAAPAGAPNRSTFPPTRRSAFEWGGFLELRPERQWLDRDRTGYRLLYAGEIGATPTGWERQPS
jgi:hypothetical protein